SPATTWGRPTRPGSSRPTPEEWATCKDRVSEVADFLDALSRLSPRESEVLRHLAQGYVNSAIAQRLHVSLSTVEKHINSLVDKLELPRDPDYSRRVLAILRHLDGHLDDGG
ncbi:response regulator transcription factor, partial [Actinomadura adrarensis]